MGCMRNAVGSFKPDMQELPSNAVEDANKVVVVEAVEAAMEETGDLINPVSEGVVHKITYMVNSDISLLQS